MIHSGIAGVLAVPNKAIVALLGTKGCGVESRPSELVGLYLCFLGLQLMLCSILYSDHGGAPVDQT